ncbi:MAG: TonB family protein [Verrucomicrobia bacterium]|jgi:TonB family protein|nr:TonB family protein [Verrucomicrobiota bacterium]
MKVESKTTLIALMLLVLVAGPLMAAEAETNIREPRVLRSVEPVVPPEFAQYDIPGEVKVVFRLSEDGEPEEIEVESATHYEYAESVRNALRQWQFEKPENVEMKFRLPVYFN